MKTKDGVQLSKKYYNEIDALKGIAIFLVILGHSIIVYPVNLHEDIVWGFVFQWLSSVHMPLLFLISGFCFSYAGSYKTYLWKKTKRILIPYVVFSMIAIGAKCLLPDLINRSSGFGEAIYKLIFNGGEYWFLYILFIIFLIFPLIYKLLSKNLGGAFCTLGAILLLYYAMPSISIFSLNNVIYYLFYFTIGAMMKAYIGGKIFDIKLSRVKAIGSALILLALWCILIKFNVSHIAIIEAIIGIVFFYICVQSSIMVRAFKGFGIYSLQLYLLNGFLLVISRTIIISLLAVTEPFIIVLFNMLVTFALSYIGIKYICSRIKPIRFLMGMVPQGKPSSKQI